jgi:centromeric protein E
LDGHQTKSAGYSAIYTPVKKLGNHNNVKEDDDSSSQLITARAAVVTPAPITTTTGVVLSTPPPPPRGVAAHGTSDYFPPPPPSSSRQSFSFNEEEAVKVCVRIRPLLIDGSSNNNNGGNNEEQPPRAWTISPTDDNTIIKTTKTTSSSSWDSFSSTPPPTCCYKFDQVYGEKSTTQQIYNDIISDIIHSVCTQGRNGTVFTYGQTSTGKTYTMHGILLAVGRDLFRYCNESHGGSHGGSREEDVDEDGFIRRRVSFDTEGAAKSSSSSTTLTTIHISCMELYNEELYDLLSSSSNSNNNTASSSSLAIHEDRRGNVLIPNLTEWKVTNINELLKVIEIAEEKRATGSTAMNERSSRSHTIFRIRYEVKKEEEEESGCGDDGKENNNSGVVGRRKKVVTTSSTLNLVDLAGSESVRLTGSKGVRQKEGGKINQSLLTLSRVLEKLGNKEYSSSGGHINYRDSKLTRILKPSLSGNARMGAICCISPAVQYSEETKSTLDFATRTMLVTTNAKSNEVVEEEHGDMLVAEFEKEMERIRLETVQAEERRVQTEKSLHKAQDEIKLLRLQLQREREASEKEKEDTMWELMSMTRRNKDLEENMQTTLKATELNKQAMELVRRQAKELERENQELESQVKELTRRNKQLEQTNLDLKQNMEVTSTATLLNKQGMEILTKQVKDLEKDNETYRVKVQDLTIRNEGLMQINTDLKHNMQNTMSATTLNKQASESMRMQVKDLEKKNGTYVVQIGALNRRNKELENNAETSAETIEEMQDTINELNFQNEQLGKRLEMYTNKLVSKQSQENASEQRRSFEGKVHQMMGRIREEVEELSLSPKVSFD